MGRYAWRSEDREAPRGEAGYRRVTYGPGGIIAAEIKCLLDGEGYRFRMLDDDGEVMCEGSIINKHTGFEPLDDWGRGCYGCTSIEYWVTGEGGGWEGL